MVCSSLTQSVCRIIDVQSTLVCCQSMSVVSTRTRSTASRSPPVQPVICLSVCLSHLQSLLSYYQTSTLVYLSVLPRYVADGGCTESPATPRRTKPAPPDDVTPPVATPISRSYISVVWSKVGRANGPNVRYELTRMKTAQPLDSKSILSLLWGVYKGLHPVWSAGE